MCLLLSLDKVIDFGDTLNVPQADERHRKVERKEVMLFNQVAYREAVINAFVHNSWVYGHSPMFTVFQDRIEITSMGTLPPGQTREGFYAGVSLPVNEKLAEIFVQLHISERSGRGVPKIVEIYGEDAFDITNNTIKVTISYERLDLGDAPQDIPQDTPQDTPQDIPQDTPREGLSPVEEKILSFCESARSLKEILEFLGLKDRKNLRDYIRHLLYLGRIAMTIPEKPTSRNQKYITIK